MQLVIARHHVDTATQILEHFDNLMGALAAFGGKAAPLEKRRRLLIEAAGLTEQS